MKLPLLKNSISFKNHEGMGSRAVVFFIFLALGFALTLPLGREYSGFSFLLAFGIYRVSFQFIRKNFPDFKTEPKEVGVLELKRGELVLPDETIDLLKAEQVTVKSDYYRGFWFPTTIDVCHNGLIKLLVQRKGEQLTEITTQLRGADVAEEFREELRYLYAQGANVQEYGVEGQRAFLLELRMRMSYEKAKKLESLIHDDEKPLMKIEEEGIFNYAE